MTRQNPDSADISSPLDSAQKPNIAETRHQAIYSNEGMKDWAHQKKSGETLEQLALREIHITNHAERPPVPTWSQADCKGAAASTEAGRDLERQALSVMGKRIDDGLGADGCMHSVSVHILGPHLKSVGVAIPPFDSTAKFTAYAKQHPDLFTVDKIPQKSLKSSDLQPGDIIIGNKSDGDHCMVAARLPANWGGSDQAMAMLGNTGHPEWVPDGPHSPHFRVQEFIGNNYDEQKFGTHHGGPESASSQNPYNLPHATWTIIRLKK